MGKVEDDSRIDLHGVGLKIYIYLLENSPSGPRDIARALNITPSLAYYHLKRLEELGIVTRVRGNYRVSKILKIEGYVTIGRKVIPRMFIYGFFSLGMLASEIIALAIGTIDIRSPSSLMLIALTILYSITMLYEGYNMLKKIY